MGVVAGDAENTYIPLEQGAVGEECIMKRECEYDVDFDDDRGIAILCGQPAIGAAFDHDGIARVFYCASHRPVLRDFIDGEEA